jgi:hypothetical protein
MHRALAVLAAAALLASCSFLGGPTDDERPPPTPGDPSDPDAGDSFDFEPGTPRLAAGTTASVGFSTVRSPDRLRITSDDPTVLAVNGVTDAVQVAALAPGTATLTAESADGSAILDEITVRVVEVARVEFHLRTPPIESQPIDRAAGLLGSSDSLRVLFLDAGGQELAGQGRYSTTGSVELLDPDDVESRLSEIFYPGERVAVRFLALGPGTVSVDLAGRSTALPIDVVRRVRAIEIATLVTGGDGVVASDEAWGDVPVGADVIGRRGDGTFVLGVEADWTVEPAVEYWTDPTSATEVVFATEQPGTRQITATHGALSASSSFTIH